MVLNIISKQANLGANEGPRSNFVEFGVELFLSVGYVVEAGLGPQPAQRAYRNYRATYSHFHQF